MENTAAGNGIEKVPFSEFNHAILFKMGRDFFGLRGNFEKDRAEFQQILEETFDHKFTDQEMDIYILSLKFYFKMMKEIDESNRLKNNDTTILTNKVGSFKYKTAILDFKEYAEKYPTPYSGFDTVYYYLLRRDRSVKSGNLKYSDNRNDLNDYPDEVTDQLISDLEFKSTGDSEKDQITLEMLFKEHLNAIPKYAVERILDQLNRNFLDDLLKRFKTTGNYEQDKAEFKKYLEEHIKNHVFTEDKIEKLYYNI